MAAPIVSGIVGNVMGAGDRAAARAAQDQAVSNISTVSTPTIDAMKIALQKYQVTGVMTPDMEQAINLGQTDLKNIQQNPNLAKYQMSAMQKLAGISDAGGLDAESKNKLDEVLRAGETQQMSNQKAVLENRAARGMAGSGDELAAQLLASQAGANRAGQDSRAVAAMALQNQLAAINGSANLASSLDQQQYQKAAAIANKQDAISQFNVQNQQNVANQNIASRNAAQQYNLGNAQNISNANNDTANKEEVSNKGLYQQNFNNQMTKAQAQANALTGQASNLNASANATGAMLGNIGAGLGKAGMAYAMDDSTKKPEKSQGTT